MIELDRYRTLFKLHPNLRAEYSEWEERLRPSSLSDDGACKRGSVVGFYGHENQALGSPVMSFGQVLQVRSYILDDKDFNQAAWVLHEAGHDIRLVPLGLIRFVAYPTFDGKWNIIYGQPEFATLFTDEPIFGDLLPLGEDSFGIGADFQDPALSALQHLVTKHGMSSLVDAGRVKAIMRDLAPEPRWGPDVISQAVELGIVERLLGESPDYELLRTVFVRKLNDRGPAEDRAQWAIDRLAIVTGRYTARELLWYRVDDCSISLCRIRTAQQQAYSAAETITDYATAYVVDLEDCERLSPELWPLDVPMPPKMVQTHTDEEVPRGLTVVRVRDDGNRLLFSYIFDDDRAAQIAIRSLRAFHSNRRKMAEWARAGCIVTELSPASPDHSLLCRIASACSDDLPVFVGFYGSEDENWPRESLVSALQEIAPEFAGRCRFRTISVSDEQIEEQFSDHLAEGLAPLPLVAGFYRGEIVASDDGDLDSDSLRAIVQSVLQYKEKLEQAADGWAWRYIHSDNYYDEPGHIVTTALVETRDDSGGAITAGTATSFLEALKVDAWRGVPSTIFGLLTSSQAVAQETIAALCSALPYVRAQVAVIHASSNSSVWQLLVPMTMFKQESVLFKLDSPADESGDGAYFWRNSADPSGEFMSMAKGGTERAWEFVSPCMSSAELRRYAEAEYADESLASLARWWQYKEEFERGTDGWAWRYIQPSDERGRIVTTALVETRDDSGGAVSTSTAESFLEGLKGDALRGAKNTIFGLLTKSQAVAQETIAALCSALSEVEAQVAVIRASANSSVWQLLVPVWIEEESVLFKLHSVTDECDLVAAYFWRNSADPSDELMSVAEGKTEPARKPGMSSAELRLRTYRVSPCMSSEELRRYAEADDADESLAACARTEFWEGRISQAQGDEGWRLPVFCRDQDEWRKLVSEGDLDERDYAVIFIAEWREERFLMKWLWGQLSWCSYLPNEIPVLIAYDDGYVADCAAKSYEPGFRASDWVRRVEEAYGDKSLFTTWQRGAVDDLHGHVLFLEKKLPRPADLRVEKEALEKDLLAAGTWSEYHERERPIVEESIRMEAIKRFLDRYQCPAESVGAYFARCVPKFRAALESFS